MITVAAEEISGNITCPAETECECKEALNAQGSVERVIDCQNMGLTEVPNFLPFTGMTFDSLLLNDNKISGLTPNAFNGLDVKRIDLNNNRELNSFSNYAFKFLPGLEVLSIENAKMSSMSTAFRDLPELRELHLKNNQIRMLPESAFSTMTKLRHLDLCNNQAEFPSSFKSFKPLTNLEYLNLENNGLYNIPIEAIKSKEKLHSLILGYNHIRRVPLEILQGLKSLKRLELVGNPISFTKPEDGIFPKLDLEVLSLGGCTMETVTPQSFSHFSRLQNLTIRECQIQSIPKGTFKVLRHLRALDVSGNHFRLMPEVFYGVEGQLDLLKLEKMNLTEYPVRLLSRFPQLKDIYLSGNKIVYLPDGIFQKLPYRGSRIFLERNMINSVSNRLMDGVRRPASLFLADNKIRNLGFISRHPCRFDDIYIDVSNNPVHCDCETYEMIQQKIFELVGTCQSPPHHENLQLVYFPGQDQSHVAHFEKSQNATTDCSKQHRINERFECTCGSWQDVESDVVCAVYGASSKASPMISIIFTFVFLLKIFF